MRLNKNQIRKFIRKEKRWLVEQAGTLPLVQVIHKHYTLPMEPPEEVIDALGAYVADAADAWVEQWDPGDPVMTEYGRHAWELQALNASEELYDNILAILQAPGDSDAMVRDIEKQSDDVEAQLHNGEFYIG